MNEYCTCGAKLPEDARFCHKCGRPLRDELKIEDPEEQSTIIREIAPPQEAQHTPPVAENPTISFRNPIAVRAALVASALATLAGLLPLPGLFHSLWQLVTITAAGFAAVYLYQRRTGAYLSLRGGLQIGWMTGLFCFVVTIVMLTLLFAAVASMGENGIKQLSLEAGRPEIAEAFSGMMTNPAMLVFALAGAFFLMTVLASAGGALGSKVLDKE